MRKLPKTMSENELLEGLKQISRKDIKLLNKASKDAAEEYTKSHPKLKLFIYSII